MQEMLTIEIPKDEAEKAQKEIELMLVEMRAINEQMSTRQLEIDRLRRQTRVTLAEIQNILATMKSERHQRELLVVGL